jgi:purine nucleosidase
LSSRHCASRVATQIFIPSSPKPRFMASSVLIDVDPGNDDAVLIALAAATERLDIEAVTTVAGNVGLEHTTRNARAILEWLGETDVPVAPGADAPLVRELETASHVHGPRGLHTQPPEPTADPVATAGANVIVERARANPGELTLLAVGPLTNVALALALEPELPELLDDLQVMGGAAFVTGNASPTAEYNFYADPEAARRVVRQAGPKLVGLDVTNHTTVPSDTIREWASSDEPLRTLASWLAYAAPENVDDALDEGTPPKVHDATVGIDQLADVLEFESYPAEVETYGSHRGALACDDRPRTDREPNAEVAVDIDASVFQAELVDALQSLTIES